MTEMLQSRDIHMICATNWTRGVEQDDISAYDLMDQHFKVLKNYHNFGSGKKICLVEK